MKSKKIIFTNQEGKTQTRVSSWETITARLAIKKIEIFAMLSVTFAFFAVVIAILFIEWLWIVTVSLLLVLLLVFLSFWICLYSERKNLSEKGLSCWLLEAFNVGSAWKGRMEEIE